MSYWDYNAGNMTNEIIVACSPQPQGVRGIVAWPKNGCLWGIVQVPKVWACAWLAMGQGIVGIG